MTNEKLLRRTVALAGLFLVGCGPSTLHTAHDRAVNDLDCPSDAIHVYHAAGGMVVARGCGHWVQYACFIRRRDAVCIADSTPKQMQDDPGFE